MSHQPSTIAHAVVSASTASLAGYGVREAVAKISELGFGGIEVLAFDGARHSIGQLAGVWFDEWTADEVKRLRDSLGGFQHISTHAPFIDLPVFTHNKGIRRESLRQLRAAIEGTGAIGGTATAVHAHPRAFYTIEELWPDLLDTYRALGDLGARHGVRVCIETMWPSTVEQFVRLAHDISHQFVGACVDVGHVAWTVPQKLRGTAEGVALFNNNLAALVEGLGPKLMHFHVHDVRQSDWRDHRACGTGCIDWLRLFRLIGGRCPPYMGSLALELEEHDVVGALTASKRWIERQLGELRNGRSEPRDHECTATERTR